MVIVVIVILVYVVGGIIACILDEAKSKNATEEAPATGMAPMRDYVRVEVDEAIRLYQEALDAIAALPIDEEEKDHHRRQAKRRLQKSVRWVMSGGSEE